jgi:IMP cyclohydrolase
MDTVESIFSGNVYPGRGILNGSVGGRAVTAYFITGRGENSRNRVFAEAGDALAIFPFDEKKVADPKRIFYTPLRVCKGNIVVTNGDHTDTVCESLLAGHTFQYAMSTRCYEPDAPHFTPRISGMQRFEKEYAYKLSILKAGDAEGKSTLRQTFDYEPVPGVAHFISTYQTDGSVLPSFSGEPVPVGLPDDFYAFADGLWNALNQENKVSLYVRYTDIGSGIYEDEIYNQYAAEGTKA